MFQKAPIKCPVCLKTPKMPEDGFKFIRDYQSEGENFSLFECPTCEVQFWIPFINPGGRWYEKCEENKERKKLNKQFIEMMMASRWETRQFLKNPPHKNPQNKKLLDLACSTGEFMIKAQKIGYDVFGVDFDKETIEIAKKNGFKNVFNDNILAFLKKYNNEFDVITGFEIIEHLDNPKEFLTLISNALKPDGFMAITTPNRNRFYKKITERWDFPYHHLSRWNYSSLKRLISSRGYKICAGKIELPINYFINFFRTGLGVYLRRFKRSKELNLSTRQDIQEVDFVSRFGFYKDKIIRVFFYFPSLILRFIFKFEGPGMYILAQKKSTKIYFISENLLRDTGGGPKIARLMLNNLVKEKKYLFGLINFEIGSKEDDLIKNISSGLEKEIKFAPIFISRNRKIIFSLFNVLKKEKPDIICDVSSPGIKALTFIVIKIFFPQIKYILFDHLPVQYAASILKNRIINNILIKFAFKNADMVGGTSEELVKETAKLFHLNEKRLFHIYNPIDFEDIEKKINEPILYPWGKNKYPIILSAARLDPISKDFPTLLKAFTLVLEKIDCRLIILGVGVQIDELKNLAKDLNIYDKIWFAGYQNNPYKFMSKADVFVLSSKFESFGLVLTESMACGCPIVSSDCDFGPREIITDNIDGFLTPVSNATKMAMAICQLLENPQLAKCFIENGKKKIQNFTIDKALLEYNELFESLI